MPRPNKKPDDEIETSGDVTGEYKRPNAARAIEIFDEHISPKLTHINTIKGDLKEPWQMVKDEANIPRKEFNYVQSLVEEDDDAKLEHRLRALRELLIAHDLTIAPDLVDQANGHNSANIVQFGQRRDPGLATLEDDDAAREEDFEASPEELAMQEGRGEAAE
jgi:hypothetical protein